MALGKSSSLFNPHSALLDLLGPRTKVLAEGRDLKGKLVSAMCYYQLFLLLFQLCYGK